MGETGINSENYYEDLNQFLLKIRADIEAVTASLNNQPGFDNIDAYLYQVNSFYYHSFHHHFMPTYKKHLEQEITRLLNISRQENMIKRDLMANIRRYAKLYNQVKTITTVLTTARTDINHQLLAAIREQQPGPIELLHTLQQLHNSLKMLAQLVHEWAELFKEPDLLDIIESSPNYAAAFKMSLLLDKNDVSQVKSLNNFLINLDIINNLLQKLTRENDRQISPQIIREINNRVEIINRAKMPARLRLFYEHNLQQLIQKDLELISLHLEKGNQRGNELASGLAGHLSTLAAIMTRGLSQVAQFHPAWLNSFSSRPGLDSSLIAELESHISESLTSVETLVNELGPASQPDLDYFSTQINLIIAKWYEYYYTASNNPAVQDAGLLYSGLIRVCMELSMLENKTALLQEKHVQTSRVSTQFLTILNMLDNYLNLMGNIKGDLERLLAPRNITRLWKDAPVRIERIALEEGRSFPADYQYILDKCAVETRITSQDNMTVLHEEGDIFIIRIDELIEEEVPYMIIGMKG